MYNLIVCIPLSMRKNYLTAGVHSVTLMHNIRPSEQAEFTVHLILLILLLGPAINQRIKTGHIYYFFFYKILRSLRAGIKTGTCHQWCF